MTGNARDREPAVAWDWQAPPGAPPPATAPERRPHPASATRLPGTPQRPTPGTTGRETAPTRRACTAHPGRPTPTPGSLPGHPAAHRQEVDHRVP